MQWDLIGEHESAYGEEHGNEIDKLVDMFDAFLDMRHINMRPRSWYEVCIDIFPCDENIETTIPMFIQKYFDMYFDKKYVCQMKAKYSLPLHITKELEGDMEDIFSKIFELYSEDNKNMSREDSSEYYKRIKNVSADLGRVVNSNEAVLYRIEKDTLDNLADIYLGIVFWGYIVKIKGYSIVVIFGTSD